MLSLFQILLVFMSNEYEKDDKCRSLYIHAKDVLKKPFILVFVGTSKDWQESALGLELTASEEVRTFSYYDNFLIMICCEKLIA